MNQTLKFILLFLTILSINGHKYKSQDKRSIISQPGRIEFERTNDRSDFHVIIGNEDGLLVLEDTHISTKKDGSLWKIHLIDTSLQVIGTRSEMIASEASLIDYEYSRGDYFILFNKNRYRGQELLVYKYSASTEEVNWYELKTFFPISIEHFEAIGESLLIAGYTNFRPVVITYDLNNCLPKVVSGFYESKNKILDVIIDDKANLFIVVLTERMRNKKNTMRVKTFNERGDLVEDNRLDPGEKKNFLDGTATTFSGGLQFIAGTYSRNSSRYSQGIYLSKFVNGQQQFNKYYPFAELSNFWDYLKPKKEMRIQKRITRKKEKGKVKKFNYRLQVHQILQRGEEYILMAEAYYPRYDYSNNGMTNQGYWNRVDPYFLGYKYTHAVVIAFDKNCNILWDHAFKIENKKSFFLKENVTVTLTTDQVVLMYLEENEIRSKVTEKDQVIESKSFSPIRLSNASDKLSRKNSPFEKIERWYKGSSVAYGEQTIRNTILNESDIREVFYINKVKCNNAQQPN